MADITTHNDNKHSPLQILPSISTAIIPVASIHDTITSILHDDRFKNELALLIDKQVAMQMIILTSPVILTKSVLDNSIEAA